MIKIEAGVCGFQTQVTTKIRDDRYVSFDISSGCEKVRALAAALPEVDAYNEIKQGFQGVIFTAVHKHMKGCCAGCVVPCGVFKAMQVAAGLALPCDAKIEISAVDTKSGAGS